MRCTPRRYSICLLFYRITSGNASAIPCEMGFVLPDSGVSHEFLIEKTRAAAEIYLALGWSVIPTQGKVAAVPWKPYQHRRPSLEQLHQWFRAGGHTGVAIVTGPVSQLAVLDFDDEALYRDFQQRHPQLADTRAVQTRRGCHLYFHVPGHLRFSGVKTQGADLQYTGHYVIAPPSVIDGHTYTLIGGGMPRTLSRSNADAIVRFLQTGQGRALNARPEPPEIPRETDDTIPDPGAGMISPTTQQNRPERPTARPGGMAGRGVSPHDLAGRYRRSVFEYGRNNALFRIACQGRDHGLSPAAFPIPHTIPAKQNPKLHTYRQDVEERKS